MWHSNLVNYILLARCSRVASRLYWHTSLNYIVVAHLSVACGSWPAVRIDPVRYCRVLLLLSSECSRAATSCSHGLSGAISLVEVFMSLTRRLPSPSATSAPARAACICSHVQVRYSQHVLLLRLRLSLLLLIAIAIVIAFAFALAVYCIYTYDDARSSGCIPEPA